MATIQSEPIKDGVLNLAEGVRRHALRSADRAALSLAAEAVTYGALAQRAALVAAWVSGAARGEAGARIGVLAGRERSAYEAILGTSWAGCAFVPLNPRVPDARLAVVLRRARLSALITDQENLPRVREALAAYAPPWVLTLGAPDGEQALSSLAPMVEPRRVAPDTLAYLMFTSGTTGEPKGVMVTAGSLAHYVAVLSERWRLGPEDRVSQAFELSFDVSLHDLFVAWEAGAAVHVVPTSRLVAPVEWIRENRVTVWSSVPSIIEFARRLKTLASGALPSLRLSMFTGEPLSLAAARAWSAAAPNSRVENHCGATETTINCLAEILGDRPRVTPGREIVSIGTPFSGMRAAIVDEQGRFVPDDTPGELAYARPLLAAGYFDDPALTARRFPVLSHPEYGDLRWYLSGDRAYRDREGYYHHLGRNDHQIKLHGYRVELEDVEAHLRAAAQSWTDSRRPALLSSL